MEVFSRLNNISTAAWKGIVTGVYKAGVGLEPFPFRLHTFPQFITRCIMKASFGKFDLPNSPDVFNIVQISFLCGQASIITPRSSRCSATMRAVDVGKRTKPTRDSINRPETVFRYHFAHLHTLSTAGFDVLYVTRVTSGTGAGITANRLKAFTTPLLPLLDRETKYRCR